MIERLKQKTQKIDVEAAKATTAGRDEGYSSMSSSEESDPNTTNSQESLPPQKAKTKIRWTFNPLRRKKQDYSYNLTFKSNTSISSEHDLKVMNHTNVRFVQDPTNIDKNVDPNSDEYWKDLAEISKTLPPTNVTRDLNLNSNIEANDENPQEPNKLEDGNSETEFIDIPNIFDEPNTEVKKAQTLIPNSITTLVENVKERIKPASPQKRLLTLYKYIKKEKNNLYKEDSEANGSTVEKYSHSRPSNKDWDLVKVVEGKVEEVKEDPILIEALSKQKSVEIFTLDTETERESPETLKENKLAIKKFSERWQNLRNKIKSTRQKSKLEKNASSPNSNQDSNLKPKENPAEKAFQPLEITYGGKPYMLDLEVHQQPDNKTESTPNKQDLQQPTMPRNWLGDINFGSSLLGEDGLFKFEFDEHAAQTPSPLDRPQDLPYTTSENLEIISPRPIKTYTLLQPFQRLTNIEERTPLENQQTQNPKRDDRIIFYYAPSDTTGISNTVYRVRIN